MFACSPKPDRATARQTKPALEPPFNIFPCFFSRLSTGHNPARGSKGGFKKSRGSSRVGSGGVGSITGRAGSDQEVFFNVTGRVGSP